MPQPAKNKSLNHSLFHEIESAIEASEPGHLANLLRKITDLFVSFARDYSDEEMAIFDECMTRLSSEVELSARVSCSERLARLPKAPQRVIRELAMDDAIEVARPVLTFSKSLDMESLLQAAAVKSQGHLLAISQRDVVPKILTDVLLDRGNKDVVVNTVRNNGAAISEWGYLKIVEQAAGDDELTLSAFNRDEIPRAHMLRLIARASENVRIALLSQDSKKKDSLDEILALASDTLFSKSRDRSLQYASVKAYILSLHDQGELSEAQLSGFVEQKNFDATIVTLSILGGVTVEFVERAIARNLSTQIIVLARKIGLSWETAKGLIGMAGQFSGKIEKDLDKVQGGFVTLQKQTAERILRFHQLREQAEG